MPEADWFARAWTDEPRLRMAHGIYAARDFCFLYTDMSNPTSNRIYLNIGYSLVCESKDYAFENQKAGA